MALVVQKFGGTSVADPDRMREVADHVARTERRGDEVVLVVSAMGKETDDLLYLASQISARPAGREMDMLITAGERKATADDPRYVERFEVFIGGTEQGDNWTELNDPVELRRRFDEEQARKGTDEEAHPLDFEFIEAMEHGMPPTTGLGPGIERLAMLLTETDDIGDVIYFPLVRPLQPPPT